jgi:Ethanolamine utilization protein EutJ (predicted chaperonin)
MDVPTAVHFYLFMDVPSAVNSGGGTFGIGTVLILAGLAVYH